MSETPGEMRPANPADPGGPSSPPSQPQTPGPPQDQRPSQQPYVPQSQPPGAYVPPGTQYGAPGTQYTPPAGQYGAPGTQYTPPAGQYGAPPGQYGQPGTQYGAPPGQYAPPPGQYGPPGTQYGAPPGQYAMAGTRPGSAADSPARQDHLAAHLVWEAILFGIAILLVIVALASTHGVHFSDVFQPVGYLGIVAAGLALSLRTGSPNLAVGSIAVFTGVLGAHLASSDHWPLWVAMAVAVVIAAIFGLIAGLVVAGLSLPAWAVTLAVALLLESAAIGVAGDQPLTVAASYSTLLWVAMFVVISVGGAALWLIPGVHARFSASSNPGAPGQWTGLRAGLGAVAGLTGSSLLAGIGGVALAIFDGAADPVQDGINVTLIALAAVLIGGVSVFGRRAGLLGTAVGTVMVTTALFIVEAHFSVNWYYVPAGILVFLGLGVSRIMESVTNGPAPTPAAQPASLSLPPGVPPGPAAP
jgi:ribose/xylose/arabinose/galactoside ABC-type transport system permease subunit